MPIGSQGGYDLVAQLLPRGLPVLALELIVANYYVLTLLLFIAATACSLVLIRRLRP